MSKMIRLNGEREREREKERERERCAWIYTISPGCALRSKMLTTVNGALVCSSNAHGRSMDALTMYTTAHLFVLVEFALKMH